MIEESTLYNLFVEKNMTRKEIAIYLNTTESHIKYYLSKYNITKPKDLRNNLIQRFTNITTTKGKKWFNNGVIETLAYECPDGFFVGKLKSTTIKISQSLKGHQLSEETKEKIKQKALGRKWSDESKEKLSNTLLNNHPMKGKHHTDKTKELIKEKRSKQLMHSPVLDPIINFLDNNGYENYINNNVIDLEKIFVQGHIEDNGNNRKLIYNYYRFKGYEISFGLNHKSENLLNNFISDLYKGKIIRNTRKIIKGFELDFYFPELKLAIEFNGNYWHSVNKKGLPIKYHFEKSLACRKQGIRLIHIWEDQWNNERLRPILEGIIKHALRINDKIEQIYARKCEIKEIDPKTYKNFCDLNHTQLSRPAKIKLGLYHNNELVQVASFSPFKARNGVKTKKVNYDWEFIRGCESFNHSRVIGGVSKLFSYFIKKYDPKSVLCYSDFNFFCGAGYEQCGFVLDGFTGPDKFYINEKGERINRSAKKYKKYLENVKSGKWLLCYGAGSLRFIWKKETEM